MQSSSHGVAASGHPQRYGRGMSQKRIKQTWGFKGTVPLGGLLSTENQPNNTALNPLNLIKCWLETLVSSSDGLDGSCLWSKQGRFK